MSKYSRVLIPIDLSLGAGELNPAVRRMVDTPDAEITLLHVVESQPWVGRTGQTVRMMRELELFANRQFRGARVSRRIEWGRLSDCVLSVIRSARSEVVLMSAGRAPRGGSALGPAAGEVLSGASCPVLLEWADAPPVNVARNRPVCCAIEFDGGEETVVQEAAWAAERLGSPLRLIGAVASGSTRAALWDPAERKRETDRLRSRLQDLCTSWAPGADIHVGVGLPVSVISRALRLAGARLLVTGGSGESVLAAEAECPVLYVGFAARQRCGRSEDTQPLELAARRIS